MKCLVCDYEITKREQKELNKEFLEDNPAHAECYDSFDNTEDFYAFVAIKKGKQSIERKIVMHKITLNLSYKTIDNVIYAIHRTIQDIYSQTNDEAKEWREFSEEPFPYKHNNALIECDELNDVIKQLDRAMEIIKKGE